MLNPDGVIVGNYRCSLSGRDLNRNYKTILKDAYPSIWHTREMVKRLGMIVCTFDERFFFRRFMNETELILYCDFHGHSKKQNVFIYGCENKHSPGERLKEKIFPAMLAKNDPTKVRFLSFSKNFHFKIFDFSFLSIPVNLKYKKIKKEPDELSCGQWVL
jgi:hypothetical protein